LTNFALYTSEYFGDNQAEEYDEDDELKKHKELIILLESVRYCKTNTKDRIRYTKLKRNSNDRLANLTGGKDTDFGGSFEHYIRKFEGEYDGFKGLVERIKDDSKTFIIPDIGKIGSLFDKFKLKRVLEQNAAKPIFIEYDDSVSPLFSTFFSTDIPREGKVVHLIHPPGVYIARYYYKDGHPVFLQQKRPDEPGFCFSGYNDPYPFYTKTNYLYKKDISKDETVFASDKWNISASVPNGYRNLDGESLHRLLKVGKKIASIDRAKPFKLTIEYQGDSSEIE
jgi:hypothetical protein